MQRSMDKSQQQRPSQSAVGDGDARSPQPNTNLQVAGNRQDSDNQLSALMSLNRLDEPAEGAVGGIPDDDHELRSAGNVQELLDNEIDLTLQKPLPESNSSVDQTACSVVSGSAVAGPKQSKKGSKLWNFWKRGRRSTVLQKCVETGEDDDDTADVTSCISTQRRPPTGRDRQSPTSGNLHRLSMGAGSRSFGALMAVVPPAPLITMTDNTHVPVFIGGHRIVSALPGSLIQHDPFDLRIDDVTAANPVGYPHLHFSQSLSTSSSSSSNSSAAGILVTSVMPQTMAVGDLAPPTMGLSVTQQPTVHTQVDYMHCLVPDLLQLTNCCFYWGVMDRYEAERLLDGRPEGTFLIRDSAQEEFLFSVSFRRYGRSLHARIEQWNHRFSFDSHDPDVFAAPSVCALVEHYKDPAACMFFEPMLTLPLPRVFAFTLQHLCRAAICSKVTYDNISSLQLPRQMQDYLKYYHYKQRICVRRFEGH